MLEEIIKFSAVLLKPEMRAQRAQWLPNNHRAIHDKTAPQHFPDSNIAPARPSSEFAYSGNSNVLYVLGHCTYTSLIKIIIFP